MSASSPIALPLLKLSQAIVRAFNSVNRLHFSGIQLADQTWRWAWQITSLNVVEADHFADSFKITATWLGMPFSVIVPKWLFAHTLSVYAPALHGLAVPESLLTIVANKTTQAWLQHLPGAPVARVITVEPYNAAAEAQQPDQYWLSARLQVGNADLAAVTAGSATLLFGLSPQTVLELTQQLQGWRRKNQRALLPAGLPIQMQLEIGRETLPLTLLRRVSPDDIIFFNEYGGSDNELLVHFVSGRHCVFQANLVDANKVVLIGIGMNEQQARSDEPRGPQPDEGQEDDFLEFDANDETLNQGRAEAVEQDDGATYASPLSTEAQQHPQDAQAFAAIPVSISFDIGQCEMTLGKLQTLVPGSIVELGRSVSRVVFVRANGKLIARGELIEIDGRTGVLIAECTSPVCDG